jgi:hypothetical protein
MLCRLQIGDAGNHPRPLVIVHLARYMLKRKAFTWQSTATVSESPTGTAVRMEWTTPYLTLNGLCHPMWHRYRRSSEAVCHLFIPSNTPCIYVSDLFLAVSALFHSIVHPNGVNAVCSVLAVAVQYVPQ